LPVNAADGGVESSWITVSSMPTKRGQFGIAVVSGKIYAIGGVNGDGVQLSIVEEYNPLTNSWSSKMSMPTPRSGFATVVCNNKIYVIGGSVGNGFVGNNEMYDPVTNSWTSKASMPTPRADLTANLVDGQIFLVGGKVYSSQSPYYASTGINECYDPVADSWYTGKAVLQAAVHGYASAVLDGKIHVIGGVGVSKFGSPVVVNNNQVYDVQTDEWSLAVQLPVTSSYGGAAVTEGFLSPQALYYVGGVAGNQYSNQVSMLTLSNNSWVEVADMSTARSHLGLAVVDDKLYAIGGFDGVDWLDTIELYTPTGYGTVPPKIFIVSPENKTYQQVTLDYTVNRAVAWMSYSLDGRSNVTFSSQTRLLGLSQGSHRIVIFANDSFGNMAMSNTVYFSVDTRAPSIVIVNPVNQSYDSTDIQLLFITDDANATFAYSLDGQPSLAIIGNTTLVALSNGPHRVTIYATDSIGNMAQQTVHFNVAPFPWLLVVAVLTIGIILGATGYIFFKRKKMGAEVGEEVFSMDI